MKLFYIVVQWGRCGCSQGFGVKFENLSDLLWHVFSKGNFQTENRKTGLSYPFVQIFAENKIPNFATNSIFLTFLTFFTLLIFQTLVIWSHRILSLKYLRSNTQGCKDIGFRTSEFVAKTRFLSVQVAWSDHIVLINQTDNIILVRYIKVSFELVKLILTFFFQKSPIFC